MFFLARIVGIIGGTYGMAAPSPLPSAWLFSSCRFIPCRLGARRYVPDIGRGVFFYSVLSAVGEVSTSPNWLLGSLFGAGGFVGISIGARLPEIRPLKDHQAPLSIMIVSLAFIHIVQFFDRRCYRNSLLSECIACCQNGQLDDFRHQEAQIEYHHPGISTSVPCSLVLPVYFRPCTLDMLPPYTQEPST
jgi:hypothetical protein